jgi:hypothetical protein
MPKRGRFSRLGLIQRVAFATNPVQKYATTDERRKTGPLQNRAKQIQMAQLL